MSVTLVLHIKPLNNDEFTSFKRRFTHCPSVSRSSWLVCFLSRPALFWAPLIMQCIKCLQFEEAGSIALPSSCLPAPPPSYCSGLADEYIFFVHSPLQSLSLPRPTLNQWLEGKKNKNPVGRFHFCSCVPGGLRWGKASAPTHDLCKPGAALSDASLGRVHKCDSSRRSEIQPSRRPRGGVRKHGDLWSSWRWKIPIMVPSAAGELWN